METPILSRQEPTDSGADLIKESTTQAFLEDVVEASNAVPVLVDFWAPWCGPCRQLTPTLEKAVRAAKGKIRLVKLNIDEHPAIPGQMGVQSIPAVFAFKDGRPVDGFLGALPESQVTAFVARLIASDEDEIASALDAAAEALASGDPQGAAEIYAALLEDDPANADAVAGLARVYLDLGDLDRAEQTLQMVPPAKAASPAIGSVKAALELARKGPRLGDASNLRGALAQNPDDAQLRFDLALALNAEGDRQSAVDELLTLVRRRRNWNDEAARKQLVQFFDAWGPQEPATVSGRQRLSSILFS